jgi:GNAT superfamily N-acetyltransferase
MTNMTHWAITPTPVDHPDAAEVLRRYFTDIVGRYYGRPATESEVDSAMAGEPSTDLAPPTGLFLVARRDRTVAGCVGLRVVDSETSELTRMFVHPDWRRRRGGSQLIAAAEEAALGLGATVMHLDTRHDLVEARALYAHHGYVEVEPFSDSPYADHWFEKKLS